MNSQSASSFASLFQSVDEHEGLPVFHIASAQDRIASVSEDKNLKIFQLQDGPPSHLDSHFAFYCVRLAEFIFLMSFYILPISELPNRRFQSSALPPSPQRAVGVLLPSQWRRGFGRRRRGGARVVTRRHKNGGGWSMLSPNQFLLGMFLWFLARGQIRLFGRRLHGLMV